jgi:Concanavalin A-like lectin/glucanases superfamily
MWKGGKKMTNDRSTARENLPRLIPGWRALPVNPTGKAGLKGGSCRHASRIFVLGLALSLLGSCSAPGDSGLIAYWKFDEGSGSVVKDSSGNGNDGTIVPINAPEPKWGTGTFAGSISLSGADDNYVRIAASKSLNSLKKQITVVAHIYPRTLWSPGSSSTGYIAVVQRQWREAVHPDLFYLGYGPKNDVLHYKWHLGLTGAEIQIYELPPGQDKPAVGEWVHLVGTYDGETGKALLYVNGKRIGKHTHAGEIRLDQESLDRPLAIGAEINGPDTNDASGEFDGYVDEVRIYDRVLSDEEIKNLADEARRNEPK